MSIPTHETVTTAELHPAHGELVRRFTPAELPTERAPLSHEIRKRLALTALLLVVQRHEPSFIGNWVLCSECANISWPLPEDPKSMWSEVVYPCATVRDIAEEAYGLVIDWAAGNEAFLCAVRREPGAGGRPATLADLTRYVAKELTGE